MRNKNKAGIVCVVCGVLLLLGSLALYLVNQRQNAAAEDAAQLLVSQMVQQMLESDEAGQDADTLPELQIPVELLTEEDKKMTEVEIDGYNYIGYLSIPTLELDLPIMSDWSYEQLNIAPCRYHGSIRGEDLVLMAHNFTNHFGRISQLEIGDSVTFTDMDAGITQYEVVGLDILEPEAVDVVTAGEFDLIFFTCTYGGSSRVVVYCNQV